MKIVWYLCLLNFTYSFCDYVIVHNECGYDLYGAIYYHKKDRGFERRSEIKLITPKQFTNFDIPGFRLFHYRDFIFSLNKGDLLENLSEEQGELLGKKNVGSLTGDNFYIAIKDGHLNGYNRVEWMVLAPTLEQLTPLFSYLDTATLGMLRRRYYVDPYSKLDAGARFGNNLVQQELNYLSNRSDKTHTSLEKALSTKLKSAPRIALCTSGGGDRAMIGTLGFLKGIEEIGLLDSASYISTLSGSTWLVAPWITSDKSLDTMQSRLNKALATDLASIKRLGFSNIAKFSDIIMEKVAFKQPINAISDLYGFLLADTLLKDLATDPRKIFLADQINKIKDANKPFPIYTAISTIRPYKWLEFTPYEIGSSEFGANGVYIPSWALNRQFVNGKSLNYAPPVPLASLMAIWGSAFGINLEELLRELLDTNKLSFFMHKELLDNMKITNLENTRILAPEFLNYLYGLLNLPTNHPKQKPIFELTDAGIAFNLPLPPLLRPERQIDVIIIFDASASGIEKATELKKLQEWAKRTNTKLPDLNFNISESCHVFTSSDPKVPVFIYIPFIKNKAYTKFNPEECLGSWCGTFNFVYTPEQISDIVDFVKFSVVSNKEKIFSAIKQKYQGTNNHIAD